MESQLALAFPDEGQRVVDWVARRAPRENALWIPELTFMNPVEESPAGEGSDEEMGSSD